MMWESNPQLAAYQTDADPTELLHPWPFERIKLRLSIILIFVSSQYLSVIYLFSRDDPLMS